MTTGGTQTTEPCDVDEVNATDWGMRFRWESADGILCTLLSQPHSASKLYMAYATSQRQWSFTIALD